MKKILVIEDEAETLDNLVLMLEMEGFRPLAAANGRIGVEIAINTRIVRGVNDGNNRREHRFWP